MSNSPETAVPSWPRVLLVEDDVALLHALEFSLRIEGFDVEPMEQAEVLLAHPFDGPLVIVTDHNLPGLSGFEAIVHLRERGVHAPAVLISAEPPRGLTDERARKLGLTVVEKPILGDRLISVLRTLSGTARR